MSDDPFEGGEKTPAVSFKDAPIGHRVVMKVAEAAKLQQQSKFNLDPNAPRELAFWPDGNPKMAAVVTGLVDGERRALWAPKPSSMFAAIRDAQATAGARIAPGGTLTVTLTGEKPTAGFAQKLYTATYQPGAAGDAFGEQSSAPAQAAPAPAAPAAPTTDPGAELKGVVSKLRAAGLSDEQITRALVSKGHDVADVALAL